MSQNTTIGQITAALTSELARTKTLAAAEGRIGAIAATGLIAAVETALHGLAEIRMEQLRDELHAALPPICGGAPDFEEIDPEFEADPAGWPGIWMPELDVYDYEPTPDHVLALDAYESAERCDSDWDAFYALRSSEVCDEDLLAIGLACG